MTLANREQRKEIAEDLTAFVHRVVSSESKATPAEIAALPEIAKVLCMEVSFME